MTGRFVFAVTLFWLLGNLAAAQEQTYPIQLRRSLRVGDRYQIDIVEATIHAWTTNDRYAKYLIGSKDISTANGISTEVEILAADAQGYCTKESILMHRITQSDAKREDPIAPAETLIVGTLGEDDQTRYTGPAELDLNVGELHDLIDNHFTLSRRYNNYDQQAFGSSTPRKAGEHWKIDPNPLIDSWRISKIEIDPAAVSGEAALKEVRDENGAPVLDIRADTIMKPFPEIRRIGPPDPFNINRCISGMKTAHHEWIVPTDSAAPILSCVDHSVRRYEYEVEQGPLKFRAVEMSTKETITQIKPLPRKVN